jgi:hypothetical protein
MSQSLKPKWPARARRPPSRFRLYASSASQTNSPRLCSPPIVVRSIRFCVPTSSLRREQRYKVQRHANPSPTAARAGHNDCDNELNGWNGHQRMNG